MKLEGKDVVVLYLTDWQMRMVKDFLGDDCHRIHVPVEHVPNTLYGVFPPAPDTKKMYLTDWQMRELRDEAGMTCDFIELKKHPHPIPMYMVQPS